jgi:hypothetical protein
MTAIATRAEVDDSRTLRLAVPCDLPPGPVDVVIQFPAPPTGDELPAELAAAVASLAVLDDEVLWRTARGRLADELSRRTEELHHKRQREGLTAAETEEVAGLVRQYERVLLLRAKAAELLRARGHDVSGLLTP